MCGGGGRHHENESASLTRCRSFLQPAHLATRVSGAQPQNVCGAHDLQACTQDQIMALSLRKTSFQRVRWGDTSTTASIPARCAARTSAPSSCHTTRKFVVRDLRDAQMCRSAHPPATTRAFPNLMGTSRAAAAWITTPSAPAAAAFSTSLSATMAPPTPDPPPRCSTAHGPGNPPWEERCSLTSDARSCAACSSSKLTTIPDAPFSAGVLVVKMLARGEAC